MTEDTRIPAWTQSVKTVENEVKYKVGDGRRGLLVHESCCSRRRMSQGGWAEDSKVTRKRRRGQHGSDNSVSVSRVVLLVDLSE